MALGKYLNMDGYTLEKHSTEVFVKHKNLKLHLCNKIQKFRMNARKVTSLPIPIKIHFNI